MRVLDKGGCSGEVMLLLMMSLLNVRGRSLLSTLFTIACQ